MLQAYDSSEKALPKAKQAASIAQERDPALAEPYAVLGFVGWKRDDWDWKAADAEFRKAQALDPDSATVASYYAFELASAGNFEEALMQVRHAVELDPISLGLTSQMAYLELLYRQSVREAGDPSAAGFGTESRTTVRKGDAHRGAIPSRQAGMRRRWQSTTKSRREPCIFERAACDSLCGVVPRMRGRAGRSREAGKLLNGSFA